MRYRPHNTIPRYPNGFQIVTFTFGDNFLIVSFTLGVGGGCTAGCLELQGE